MVLAAALVALAVGTSARADSYWDINGTTPGAGGATPAGTWDATNTFWNGVADGTGATAAWTGGGTAAFAAGTDATGAYTVTAGGTQDIGGLTFEEGTVTISGGALRLVSNTAANVAPGLTATVSTPIGQDATARSLTKTGAGTLVLTVPSTYGGPTVVSGGTLKLEAPTGGPPSSGMIGYWNLDEGAGVTAADTAGVPPPHDGTLNTSGTPQATWTGAATYGPSAIQVTGQTASTAMQTSSNCGITGTTPRTISARVTATSTAAEIAAHALGDGNGDTGRWDLFGLSGAGWKNNGGGQWFDFAFANNPASNELPDCSAGWLVLNNSAGYVRRRRRNTKGK